jgi:hypothetical protein
MIASPSKDWQSLHWTHSRQKAQHTAKTPSHPENPAQDLQTVDQPVNWFASHQKHPRNN